MRRLLFLSALAAVAVIAQAPTSPRLWVYWIFPGDTAWTWKSVTIDPPLTLTKDAAGNAHLGSTAQSPVACLPDDVIPVTTARATFPVKQFPIVVYLNGLRQSLGGDYTQDTVAMTITFVPQAVPGQGETVTIEYRCLGQ